MLQSGMDTAPDFLFTRSSKTGGAPRCAYPSKTRIVSENNCCRLRSKTALTSIDPFPSWFTAISRKPSCTFCAMRAAETTVQNCTKGQSPLSDHRQFNRDRRLLLAPPPRGFYAAQLQFPYACANPGQPAGWASRICSLETISDSMRARSWKHF